jgi:branched-chain amino acid aminotransferase
MGTESKYIWMDGKLVEFDKATIHFLNPTLHYGMGVFEGIRSYKTERGAAVFRLKEHIRRLFDSAKEFGMVNLPYSESEICEAVKQTVAANFPQCYIRPLVYYASG